VRRRRGDVHRALSSQEIAKIRTLGIETTAMETQISAMISCNAHRKARAVAQRAGHHSRWRAGATSILGRAFCLPSRRTARWAGPWAFYKWRDAGIVPLICPTCQNVFAGWLKASPPATQCYFAWGCFRYFSWGAGLPSRSSHPARLRPRGLRRGSLRSLRSKRSRAGLPSRSSRSERRLVGLPGLEPGTRPL
jgi:hypothetical protein